MSLLPAAWSPECWSLPYFYCRLREFLYRKTHPDLPWLTPEANRILAAWIQPHHRVLEFGSGKSTLFFAEKAAHVTSVEHDPTWAGRVEDWIRAAHLDAKTTLIHCLPDETARAPFTDDNQRFDLILVDGVNRLSCAINSLSHLKPGGWLVLDNINRFVPTGSKAPGSIQNWSETPAEWKSLMEILAPYEHHWTRNGITETLLIKINGHKIPLSENLFPPKKSSY